MHKFKKHILFIKWVAFFLGFSILVPSIQKFAHIFAHHEHDLCKNETQHTHLHESSFDCEFHKFKLNTNYHFSLIEYCLFTPKAFYLKITTQYYFISKFQRLQTALRGPPVFI